MKPSKYLIKTAKEHIEGNIDIYEAKDIFKLDTPKAMDEDEVINSYFLDLEEAYKQVLDGTIKDSKTMIAIQYAIILILNKIKVKKNKMEYKEEGES